MNQYIYIIPPLQELRIKERNLVDHKNIKIIIKKKN